MTNTPEQERPETEGAIHIRKRAQTEETAEATETAASPEGQPSAEEAPRGPRRRVFDATSAAPEAPAAKEPASARALVEEEPAQLEDFAALLAQDDASRKSRAQSVDRLEQGQQVRGKVVLIGEENIFIDLGRKTEGFLPRGDAGLEGRAELQAGDELDCYIVNVGPAGVQLTLTMSLSSNTNDALEAAYRGRIPVEGKVTAVNKGGFEVSVLGQRAFCPMSQIDSEQAATPEVHIGQTYRFLVTRCERQGKFLNVVVSRTELIREERAVAARETWKTLAAGQIREGIVRRTAAYGAFVDLGGVDGLVHISEMGWDRVEDPTSLVRVGEKIQVKILEIKDRDAGPEKARIALSMKAVLASPWSDVAERFKEGTVCTGEVVRIEAYGAFVQVAPGVDGLVHVSELALGRIVRPQDVVQVGQSVQVQVKSLDLERQRLSLSMKALLGDPWDRVREKYAEDLEIEGTVEKIEEFGIFVTLEPGLTGLIPLSESNTERGRSPHRDFLVGSPVKARILAIDEARRRLTLTRRPKDEAASDDAAPAAAGAPAQDRQPREVRDGDRKAGRDQGQNQRDERRTDRREERGERQNRPGDDRERAANKAASSYRENTKLGTFADLFPAKLRRKD